MPRRRAESPIGEAMAWASRIMAIGLTMFVPGVVGGWLDGRLGTKVVGPAGFVLGFTTALVWLVSISRARRQP